MINDAGLALIKDFEGFSAHAYRCPAGVWTIGYGHTGDVHPGDLVTREEAEVLLHADLRAAETAVDRLIDVPLNANQFAALVSFVYNVGSGALRGSTLRRLLNQGDYNAVPAQLARWNKAGGKVLAGLTRRRAAEARLWSMSDGA